MSMIIKLILLILITIIVVSLWSAITYKKLGGSNYLTKEVSNYE